MNATKLLALAFLRFRPLLALAVVLLTILATMGYARKSEEHRWARQSSDREVRRDVKKLREVNATFDLRRIEYFLVVDTDDVFTSGNAAALRSIATEIADLDIVAEVIWLGAIPSLNLFDFGGSMLPANDASQEVFAAARERAINHPLISGQLLSDDGKTVLMLVTFDWVYFTGDEDVSSRLVQAAEQGLKEHAGADVQVGVTGEIPLYLAQRDAHERNHRKYQIIGYALTAIVATLLFRGLAPIMIVSGAAAFGIYWSIGLLHLVGQEINPLTGAVLPLMLAMVGISDGVHLMVHIRHMRHEGMSPKDSAGSAIEHIGMPCLLTSVTTAVGFGSLMLADSHFVQSFGQACAMGVGITFLAVVTIIPLLSSTRLGKSLDRGQERDFIGHNLEKGARFVDWIIARRRKVTLLAIGLTICFALIASRLRPDSNYATGLPSNDPAYLTLVHCDEKFGGIEFARVVVEWPETLQADSAQILAAVTDVEQILAEEPLLANVVSLRGLLNTFPGEKEHLHERMSLVELLPQQVRDLFINSDARQTQIRMRVRDVGIAAYEPVFQRVESQLVELGEKHQGFEFHLTGSPVVRGRNLYQILVDLASSLGAASIVILVIMAVVYRSLRLGLIAVIPNMFPLLATASLLALTGGSLDLSSVCAFTVCLGIAVDDTIHFLSRFKLESQSYPVREAIRRTWIRVGTALIMTTIVMVSGFATVLTSELPQQRIFGSMACVTIAAALLGDMVFLPAMLAWFTPSKPDELKHNQEQPALETKSAN